MSFKYIVYEIIKSRYLAGQNHWRRTSKNKIAEFNSPSDSITEKNKLEDIYQKRCADPEDNFGLDSYIDPPHYEYIVEVEKTNP